MNNTQWRFPLLDGGSEQGFNNGGIATFKGSDLYDNLAREICQNSLDAKRIKDSKVKLEFQIKSFEKKKYNALQDLDLIFDACEKYWQNKKDTRLDSFLQEAKNTLSNDLIDCLVISDYNTTGLTGSKLSIQEKSVWRALTHSDGVTNKGNTSAGSYGIGKNAPFACSSLRTVFYNTYAEDGVKAFQGVSRLVTHKNTSGEFTQGVGFYQKVEGNERSPIFEDDNCSFRDNFKRSEYGTDVIIIGLNKIDSWENNIEKAIINNFFVSIYKDLLEVKVGSRLINKETILTRIKHYLEIEPEDEKLRDTFAFFETLISEDSKHMRSKILEDEDVELHIRKDNNYNKKIVEMRSIGMVVRIRTKNILTKYAAVLIVNGEKLNSILKNIEPPKHDKWDPDIIDNDENERKRAKNIRSQIINWTNNSINEYCKTENVKEIDPEGVSEYLSFDDFTLDSGVGNEKNASSLNLDSTIEKIKDKPTLMNRVAVQGLKELGDDSLDEEIRNENSNGISNDTSSGGTNNGNGHNDVVTKNQGTKSLFEEAKSMSIQRIMPVSVPNGIYRIILCPTIDYDKVQIELKAIGDDSRRESIPILKYTINSKSTNCNKQEYFTLTNLKAGQKYEIFVTLEYKEKMLIDLQVR